MVGVKPPSDSVLVFVHVKKTAGMSLQHTLAKQFGDRFYGGYSDITPNSLSPQNLHRVPNGSCICKHWPMYCFDKIKDRCNFVTVMRDPVQRIISHYNFYRAHHADGMSIGRYIRTHSNINIYTKMLNVDYLCEIYLFDVLSAGLSQSAIISANRLPHNNKTNSKHRFSQSQIKDFKALNAADLELYKKAQDLCLPRES